MHRICDSLTKNGYAVVLIGRKLPRSLPLEHKLYKQKRIACIFNNSVLFYAEYNLKLFFALLFLQADCYCAIDLDTILPVWVISIIKRKKRVYDAHELFTEQKEIVTRPFIKKIWNTIEKFTVPQFKYGYTVNDFIKNELQKKYGIQYEVIRNLPSKKNQDSTNHIQDSNFIIYQGAVNEGRCFETLIPAMQFVNAVLIICGEGNFFNQTKKLIQTYNVENKIILKGWVEPKILTQLTKNAIIGITLFETTGLNQYQSLANRFFDYIIAGVPQVCVNFPQYKKINDVFNIACMIDVTDTQTIANAINKLLADKILYANLKNNCIKAGEILNWETEEIKLINYWKSICI
ncbi:MAG: glycosyltransferase [Bacteroidetes bacterium]|nr:glycosyltransferase [Bacteroidota bacterium]MBS1649694.1 glycosyltransferase [Bacteroidota bacterium]